MNNLIWFMVWLKCWLCLNANLNFTDLFEILYNLNTSSITTHKVQYIVDIKATDVKQLFHVLQDKLNKYCHNFRSFHVPCLSAGSFFVHCTTTHFTDTLSHVKKSLEKHLCCSSELYCEAVWADMNFTLLCRLLFIQEIHIALCCGNSLW